MPSKDDNQIHLSHPGQARCHCGALLCKIKAASELEVKCRRCGRLLTVLLRLS
ncbi:MAG: Com family DNA-binding transcriptional regulator [Planctomycetes bacterium]|nr:Com family DNA-binding transcriptional regulator [Planctomycetota bacterium]